MANSSLVTFYALVCGLALAGCASTSLPPPTPAPIVNEAPWPRVYSCADQAKAADEMAKLPPGSVIVVWLDDYRVERRALRVAHKESPEGRCT